MPKDQPLAFSYLRLSTPEQKRGGGFARQREKAVNYASRHGLRLDARSYEDLGVSAFHGANIIKGALGKVLAAAMAGAIPEGSYLLIESLDRISRQDPLTALNSLVMLCQAGLKVVTLADERVYDADSLKRDSGSLFLALAVAVRAHEESETKSMRRADAWRRQREKAAKRGTPMTGQTPGWLRVSPDGSRFEQIAKNVAVVRRIFSDYLAGRGTHGIASSLNEEGVRPFGRARLWHRSYVLKILDNPAVIGEFTPHVVVHAAGGKKREPLPKIHGYYPPVISPEDFARAKAMRTGKRAPSGKTGKRSVSHVLVGLTRCARCGGAMVRQSKGATSRAGRPRLVCYRAKSGAACDAPSIRLDTIEDAVVAALPKLALHGHPGRTWQVAESMQLTKARRDRIKAQLESTVSALMEEGETWAEVREKIEPMAVLGPKIRSLEEALREEQEQLEALEQREIQNGPIMTREALAVLGQEAKRQELDKARINALLRQLLSRVVVHQDRGEIAFHWHSLGVSFVRFVS